IIPGDGRFIFPSVLHQAQSTLPRAAPPRFLALARSGRCRGERSGVPASELEGRVTPGEESQKYFSGFRRRERSTSVKQKTLSAQVVVLLTVLAHSANAITVFPFATNTDVAEVPSGFASSGTNALVTFLAGTNVSFQLISSNGTLVGPLTAIGESR